MSNANQKPESTDVKTPESMNLTEKLESLNKDLVKITGTTGVMDDAAKGQYANILKRLTDDSINRGKLTDIKIVKDGVTVSMVELIKSNMDVTMTDVDKKTVKSIKKQITAINTLME